MPNTQNPVLRLNLPTVALRGSVLFPRALFHFDVGREKTIRAIEVAMESDRDIFLVSQRDIGCEDPVKKDLYTIGTVAKVKQVLRISNENVRVLVEGKCRARLNSLTFNFPYLLSDVTEIPEKELIPSTKRDSALMRNVQTLFNTYLDLAPKMSGDLLIKSQEIKDMSYYCDFVSQNISLDYTEKQILLETLDPRRRMAQLVKTLTHEVDILNIEIEIQSKVKDQMDKNQRDYYLREQVKAISEELGEDDISNEAAKYAEKIRALDLDGQTRDKLLKEAERLGKMQAHSPEATVVTNYLDVCLELPWNKYSQENLDIEKAKTILEEDHYGLEKVKERILELFAVKQLSGGKVKGQILCLVGPPGVGKTSIAKSIARALGRDYARLSLGGVRDEADIRGHRKTYIGAMPGRIINALRQAGTKNCLILIDEVDKLASDYRGDPSAALLEVLDSEQNNAFRDHFIELPFDLSDVLFIMTANTVSTIPPALLDRMEVIELSSYTDEEKLMIAKKYLIKKQAEKNGLKPAQIKIEEDALRLLISDFTRESGVRNLEREIGRLCRKSAKIIVESGKRSVRIKASSLEDMLGAPQYKREEHDKMPQCGLVKGLAWTSAGGELLEVEAIALNGSGKLELTGNLGDVMKESAQAAATFVRSRASILGIDPDYYKKTDIHIHYPEGAVPKDGPSAGITAATAMISALTERPVPADIAMTGEITLRGRVLPIGGLREKTMAALREGVRTVIIPRDNVADLKEIDPLVREKLEFCPVRHMDEVIERVFGRFEERSGVVSIPPHPQQSEGVFTGAN